MKILITLFGKFHSNELANQLGKRKAETVVFSSYPKHKFYRYHFKTHTTNLAYLDFLSRYTSKNLSSYINLLIRNFHFFVVGFFLKKEFDFFISWGYTSHGFFKRLQLNKKTIIIERGSTHPLFQFEILKSEHKKHNLEFFEFKESIDIQLMEYSIANYIVVPSDFVKKTFVENGVPATKIFVNPYGVDLSSFKWANQKKQKFRIIFAGKACIRKGFHYLIEVMKSLKKYDIELWHLGSVHPEIKKFDYQQENIIYLGSKPQKEMYSFYNQCDVFVLPSLEEGLAMVTLQAMACGLPVICTPNTGIENILTTDGQEGFLVPIRDPIAIKEKVLELYNNPSKKEKMGNAALKKVSSGFTWDDYGQRYIEFLNKIQNA